MIISEKMRRCQSIKKSLNSGFIIHGGLDKDPPPFSPMAAFPEF
jgi:hypothetical protein